jgi:predicted dehydrogenase
MSAPVDASVPATGAAGLRVAVAGVDHLHLFQIVDGLVRAGAETVAHTSAGSLVGLYRDWRDGSHESTLDELLEDDRIDVVVTAAIPSERAAIAVAALRAGKAVVSAKPGVTSFEQLEEVTDALAGRPGRAWTVLFTERFENRAVAEAVRLARAGAIGEVVHVRGTGPHSLFADERPDWFWDPARSGGILVDLASHQVDQFLALVGDPGEVEVRGAAVGNVATPTHPHFQDIGSFTLVAEGVQGFHEVDFLTPPGLGTWGDVRLSIVGTTGTLEARANIDVTGVDGAEHLIHVDAKGARRVDLSAVTLDWADLLVADLSDDGERLMTQAHVLSVCDLTLRAQANALPWGTTQASSR